jgi:hypothetical protein
MGRKSLHLKLVDPSSQGPANVFTFGTPSLLVEGKYKAFGRWLHIFMTPKGSDPLDLSAGTEFPHLLGSNISDPDELETQLHLHVADATEQVRVLQTGTNLALNERVRSVTIMQFTVLSPGRFEFWVDLQVESGEMLRMLIPYAPG